MSEPRFQILSMARWAEAARLGSATRFGRDRERKGLVFGWRLLGGNNRELARGVEQYLSVQECEQVVAQLKAEDPDQLVARISFDATTHGWSWVLRSTSGEVARSARSFHRQRECLYSLGQFKDKFPAAVVHLPKSARAVGSRRQRRSISALDVPGVLE